MTLPHHRITVRRLMILVACLGIGLAAIRFILMNAPIGGLGTIYSDQYDEIKFDGLRAGMTKNEVEAIMGQPLKKEPWNQHMGLHDEEMWYYSDQPNATANYWRRWVHFHDGKATSIISDYWYD